MIFLPFHDWLISFCFTQLIEIPVYLFALKKIEFKRRLIIAFGASLMTHPFFVWFLFPNIFDLSENYTTFFIVAETFVLFAEAIYLRLFGVKYALLWSLAANGASAGFGLLRNYFFN